MRALVQLSSALGGNPTGCTSSNSIDYNRIEFIIIHIMASFEEGVFDEPAPEVTYAWVAERQADLARAAGMEVVTAAVAAADVVPRVAEAHEQRHTEPLNDRLPFVGKAVVILARMTRYADFVPGNDRAALVGGPSAVIDGATLGLLEEIMQSEETSAPDEPASAEAAGRGSVTGRISRRVRARMERSQEEQASRADKVRREKAIKDLETLLEIYAANPAKAYEIFLAGQQTDAALQVNEAFVAQYEGRPDELIAALSAGKDLDAAQQRRLLQDEVGAELGDIRREMADRRSKGLGLDASDADRYRRYEAMRAARGLDESGAIAAMDLRAERQAALVEAAERNRPDGKVLIVSDENLATPGLAGPLMALFGAAEVHTGGVPYHELTRNHLEGATGSYFPEQLTYNDINQRYAIILLQGTHPPIKPTEMVHQIGDRDGDMAVIPGNVDRKFIAELLSLLQDPYSDYHGKFRVETRTSGQVSVHVPTLESPVVEAGRPYDQPTYILVRDSSAGQQPNES